MGTYFGTAGSLGATVTVSAALGPPGTVAPASFPLDPAALGGGGEGAGAAGRTGGGAGGPVADAELEALPVVCGATVSGIGCAAFPGMLELGTMDGWPVTV